MFSGTKIRNEAVPDLDHMDNLFTTNQVVKGGQIV